MRAKEFIVEARPDNIGQGILDKLKKTYLAKEHHNSAQMQMRLENENYGLNIANAMFNAVGPDYLIWVAKQYNQDPNFFLENLPEWKDTLTEFSNLVKDKRVEIERDINKYANIDQLRDVIHVASGSKQELGSPFYSKVIGAMNQFVEEGQASWLYRSPEYSIYYPKTFEASNICKTVMSTTVCTIMNQTHFDTYSKYGTLMYIVNQDRLYNCYISKNPSAQPSEFADQENNHKFNLHWMLENFPALRPLAKKACGPKTELSVKLQLYDPKEQAAMITKAMEEDPRQFGQLPSEFQTPEYAKMAILGGYPLRAIPRHLLTPELVKIAVEKDPWNIQHVPDELETQELADMAMHEDIATYSYVSEKFRNSENSMRAVDNDPMLLEYVPEDLDNYREICITAVQGDENAFGYVPESMIDDEFLEVAAPKNSIVNVPDETLQKVMAGIKEALGYRIDEARSDAEDDYAGYEDWLEEKVKGMGYVVMPSGSPWPLEPYEESSEEQNEWLEDNNMEPSELPVNEDELEEIRENPPEGFYYQDFDSNPNEWAEAMFEELDDLMSPKYLKSKALEETKRVYEDDGDVHFYKLSELPELVGYILDKEMISRGHRGNYYPYEGASGDVLDYLNNKLFVRPGNQFGTKKDWVVGTSHHGGFYFYGDEPHGDLDKLDENASVGGTSSGSIATVSQPIGGMNRRVQNSSLLSGLLTDEEYPNTPDWIKKSKKLWCRKK